MSNIRFNEYIARELLETCFPQKYGNIQIKDKPDLQSEKTNVGIEVVSCSQTNQTEAISVWYSIKRDRGNRNRNIEHLKKLGYEYTEEGFTYIEEINYNPISDILNIVNTKIERLNSPTANYKPFDHYELFINAAVFLSPWQELDILNRLKEIKLSPKNYDVIYLLTASGHLFAFDMIKNTFKDFCLSIGGAIDRITENAYQKYRTSVQGEGKELPPHLPKLNIKVQREQHMHKRIAIQL